MGKPLRIQSALAQYNDNLPEGEPKLTQKALADLVVDKESPEYRARLISFWCNGKRDPDLDQIRKLAEVLRVDFNFLFNHQNASDEN